LERRFGLRFRMAASYVLVSAAAVLLVEAVLLAVAVPQLRKADDAVTQARLAAKQAEYDVGRLEAQGLASNLATTAGQSATGDAPQTGVLSEHDHVSFWASTPIVISAPGGSGQRRIGTAYVAIGEPGAVSGAAPPAKGSDTGTGTRPGEGADASAGAGSGKSG